VKVTASLLRSLPAEPGRVLDLGCGPGHTTELLASLYPGAELVAVERSDAFAAQARARVPAARVIIGDVTASLPGDFDLVYSRFLLSHLPDIDGAVAGWCESVAPAGFLVLEEPESIVASDALFARYEQIVAGVDRRGPNGVGELVVEPDRRSAIATAIAAAREGDAVVVAGKGHEQGQEFAGGTRVPFDDREVSREELERVGHGAGGGA